MTVSIYSIYNFFFLNATPIYKNPQHLAHLAQMVKNQCSIPGLGRSPGERNSCQYSCLETPWTEEPGGLLSMGSQRVGHN